MGIFWGREATPFFSLPPCGGGPGWGVSAVTCPDIAQSMPGIPPLSISPPQGGRGQAAARHRGCRLTASDGGFSPGGRRASALARDAPPLFPPPCGEGQGGGGAAWLGLPGHKRPQFLLRLAPALRPPPRPSPQGGGGCVVRVESMRAGRMRPGDESWNPSGRSIMTKTALLRTG